MATQCEACPWISCFSGIADTMSTDDRVEWLSKHDIPVIVNGLVEKLLAARPNDPKEFMAKLLTGLFVWPGSQCIVC